MTSFVLLSVISLFLAFTGTYGAALHLSSEIDAEILDKILHKSKYDASIRPPGPDLNKTSAVIVTFQLMIRHINFLDDIKQEVSTQLTLRLSWEDPRHRYEHIFKQLPDKAAQIPDYVVIADSSRIWYPDIFIVNEKSSFIHQVLQPNVVVRIHKNGTTHFSTRITVVTSCPMALHWYPFDKHDCPLAFAFYALRDYEGKLIWVNRQSLEILHKSELPIFQLRGVDQADGSLLERKISGNFSCVKADLHFRRRLSYYLFTVFVPCFLLCTVSWTSFWLDLTAIDARVSLGITTILAMATQLNGIAAGTPTVSYIKAIDIFSSLCQLFVTAAFLEFVTVSFIVRKDENRGQGLTNRNSYVDKDLLDQESEFPRWLSYRKRNTRISADNQKIKIRESQNVVVVSVGMQLGMKIDKICRIAFPCSFFGFAIVYFAICLHH